MPNHSAVSHFAIAGCLALGLVLPTNALAQADANAVRRAGDAFGFRQGDDSVGIYDEASVRGFSLEAAGNYRIEGGYFVKTAGVSSFFLESATVRIGPNTIGTILPGPSGVVDYRLRDPGPKEPSTLTVGLDVYQQPYSELHMRGRSQDGRTSWSYGLASVYDMRNPQGGDGGDSYLLAGVVTHRASVGAVRLFGGEYSYRRPSQFRASGVDPALLPKIPRGRPLAPSWAEDVGQRRISGVLFDSAPIQRVSIGATAVFAQEDPSRAFLATFSDFAPDQSAAARVFATPHQRTTSWSGELRAQYRPESEWLSQSIDLTVRGRRSRSSRGGTRVIQLGRTPWGAAPTELDAPLLNGGASFRDGVDQAGITLSYRAEDRHGSAVNLGVLRTDYRRSVRNGDDEHRGSATPWLFHAAGRWQFDPRLAIYGGLTRGLEEAGVAPASASNANEILEAIEAKQREAGFSWRVTPAMNLHLGAFEVRKPYVGVDPQDRGFKVLGHVRHRGVEVSLAGRPIAATSVVLGGVVLDPAIVAGVSGVGRRPVNVPRFRGVASVDYSVPAIPGLSLDASFSYVGRRPSSSAASNGRQPEAPANWPLNLGARYRLNVGERPVTVRVQVLNVFNQYRWTSDSSENLSYTPSRQLRALLTAPL